MKRSKGFTLIELLVVISIIALLSSIVLSSLNTARAKGRYATIISQMREIQTASQGYFADFGNHAADQGPGSAPDFVPTYMRAWPRPPCGSTWSYDWDNWTSSTGFVGVHLYSPSTGATHKFCTDTTSVCSGSTALDIQTLSPKTISCP